MGKKFFEDGNASIFISHILAQASMVCCDEEVIEPAAQTKSETGRDASTIPIGLDAWPHRRATFRSASQAPATSGSPADPRRAPPARRTRRPSQTFAQVSAIFYTGVLQNILSSWMLTQNS
jgi:hypothetical protein